LDTLWHSSGGVAGWPAASLSAEGNNMRLGTASAFFGLAVLSLGAQTHAASAQEFYIEGHRANEMPSPGHRVESSGGVATIEHGDASFHTIRMGFHGIDSSKLRFVLKCENGKANYKNDCSTPPSDEFIRRISIKLEGEDASKYKLTLNCRSVNKQSGFLTFDNLFGEAVMETLRDLASWCGPSEGHEVWISKLTVKVVKK
jgi:hypothetical protein